MEEIFALANKFSEIGFPTLLVLTLYGSYKGIWVWGSAHKKAEDEAAQWKQMALKAAGLAETSASIAHTMQVPK